MSECGVSSTPIELFQNKLSFVLTGCRRCCIAPPIGNVSCCTFHTSRAPQPQMLFLVSIPWLVVRGEKNWGVGREPVVPSKGPLTLSSPRPFEIVCTAYVLLTWLHGDLPLVDRSSFMHFRCSAPLRRISVRFVRL